MRSKFSCGITVVNTPMAMIATATTCQRPPLTPPRVFVRMEKRMPRPMTAPPDAHPQGGERVIRGECADNENRADREEHVELADPQKPEIRMLRQLCHHQDGEHDAEDVVDREQTFAANGARIARDQEVRDQ